MRYNKFFIDGIQIETNQMPIQGVTTTGNTFWIKVSGVWKQATTYVKVSGIWKVVTKPYLKVGGIWK